MYRVRERGGEGTRGATRGIFRERLNFQMSRRYVQKRPEFHREFTTVFPVRRSRAAAGLHFRRESQFRRDNFINLICKFSRALLAAIVAIVLSSRSRSRFLSSDISHCSRACRFPSCDRCSRVCTLPAREGGYSSSGVLLLRLIRRSRRYQIRERARAPYAKPVSAGSSYMYGSSRPICPAIICTRAYGKAGRRTTKSSSSSSAVLCHS